MTQPISNRAHWADADLTCSETSHEFSETLTCEQPQAALCAPERAHRVETSATRSDAGAADASPHVAPPADTDVLLHAPPPHGSDFCRRADTVVEGFLCNEPTIVSQACRKPNNAFDEFVCDDLKMQRLQWAILRETWSIVKAIGLALVRARP